MSRYDDAWRRAREIRAFDFYDGMLTIAGILAVATVAWLLFELTRVWAG